MENDILRIVMTCVYLLLAITTPILLLKYRVYGIVIIYIVVYVISSYYYISDMTLRGMSGAISSRIWAGTGWLISLIIMVVVISVILTAYYVINRCNLIQKYADAVRYFRIITLILVALLLPGYIVFTGSIIRQGTNFILPNKRLHITCQLVNGGQRQTHAKNSLPYYLWYYDRNYNVKKAAGEGGPVVYYFVFSDPETVYKELNAVIEIVKVCDNGERRILRYKDTYYNIMPVMDKVYSFGIPEERGCQYSIYRIYSWGKLQ